MKRITGHLTEKNGKWYTVINLYDADGKRREKWKGLDLDAKRGTKSEANHRMNEILARYNTGELYLMESLSHSEHKRRQIANMPAEEYLFKWAEQYKANVSLTTYRNYKLMTDTRMAPFFKPLGLKVRDVTGDEVNNYYTSLRADGLKGTSAQRHHSLLHLAFKHALKRRIIATNSCDQADRPKAVQFIGSFYNAEGLKSLIDALDGDPIHMPVVLAAYYGLRRSEAIRLKWSAIDLVGKTVGIRHKVVQYGTKLKSMDVMRTKSSYRMLPLIPRIEKIPADEKARQDEMRKVMRSAYNKKYADYVYVNVLGNLIRPNYVSEHFQVILRQNGFRHIRFHDLRHSCASLMLANGVPMKMIQDWLGHSDMGTTVNIYSHIDSASKLESARVIGETTTGHSRPNESA